MFGTIWRLQSVAYPPRRESQKGDLGWIRPRPSEGREHYGPAWWQAGRARPWLITLADDPDIMWRRACADAGTIRRYRTGSRAARTSAWSGGTVVAKDRAEYSGRAGEGHGAGGCAGAVAALAAWRCCWSEDAARSGGLPPDWRQCGRAACGAAAARQLTWLNRRDEDHDSGLAPVEPATRFTWSGPELQTRA